MQNYFVGSVRSPVLERYFRHKVHDNKKIWSTKLLLVSSFLIFCSSLRKVKLKIFRRLTFKKFYFSVVDSGSELAQCCARIWTRTKKCLARNIAKNGLQIFPFPQILYSMSKFFNIYTIVLYSYSVRVKKNV